MGSAKIKIEGGQGGRRGHSNMAHWISTEEIKDSARIRRRREAKAVVAKASLEGSLRVETIESELSIRRCG
jgi:hypothetical protein